RAEFRPKIKSRHLSVGKPHGTSDHQLVDWTADPKFGRKRSALQLRSGGKNYSRSRQHGFEFIDWHLGRTELQVHDLRFALGLKCAREVRHGFTNHYVALCDRAPLLVQVEIRSVLDPDRFRGWRTFRREFELVAVDLARSFG